MTSTESFGAWVRRLRRAQDLTQAALAGRIGCSAITVRKIEAGRRVPSRQIALLLAECLTVPAAERALFVAAARGREPPPPDARPGRAGLPIPPTAILGRDEAASAVRQRLLQTETRLLTLVGSPGIGKTRLALHVLAGLGDVAGRRHFPDGQVFVPLVALTDPALVLPTIARALAVPEIGGWSALEWLRAALRERQVLLGLDNLEHLLPSAPDLAALLSACPGLTILATSRAALRIRGEQLVPVEPLALPAAGETVDAAAVQRAAAGQLFVERVSAADPHFALTDANAGQVAAICARLDGLPLAIELVAARSRVLSPAELLRRLRQPLDLLTRGPSDLPPRHQTLRAAIGWSYALLSPPEQELLERLGVLPGSYPLETVMALTDDPDALETLEQLVSHSLVVRHINSGRLGMLETIREFALERLAAGGTEQAVRERHARHVLLLAETAEAHRYTPTHRLWLAQLDDELAQIRAALQWASAHHTELALRLAGALKTFWHTRGLLSEGRSYLALALAAERGAATGTLARAELALAELALLQGDHALSTAASARGLAHFERLEDEAGLADALHLVGVCAFYRSDLAAARAALSASLRIAQSRGADHDAAACLLRLGQVEKDSGALAEAEDLTAQSLTIYQRCGDERGAAHALVNLSIIGYWRGAYAQSASHAAAAVPILRAHQDQLGLAYALENMGMARFRQGEQADALLALRESLALFQAMHNRSGLALVQHELGWVALAQGDPAEALRLQRAALALAEQLGEQRRAAFCMEGLAAALCATDPAEAVRLFAAADALRAQIGAPLPDAERAALAPYQAQLVGRT